MTIGNLPGYLSFLRLVLSIHGLEAREERPGGASNLADRFVAAAVLRKLNFNPHAVLVVRARTIRQRFANPHHDELRGGTGSKTNPAGLHVFKVDNRLD